MRIRALPRYCAAPLLVAYLLLSNSRPAGSADRLDTALEKFIGAQVASALRETQGEDTDPLLKPWLQRIGKRVSAPSPRGDIRPDFGILGTDVANALAAPGGHIFVTRGLLDEVDSEEEIASVLGHETAHHAKRHAQQQIGENALAFGFFTLLRGDNLRTVRLGATIFNVLRALGKSREMERQADEVGFDYTVEAGDDPTGFIHFFEGTDLSRRSDLEQYFATHPAPADRLKAARARVASLTLAAREKIASGYESRGLPTSAALVRAGGDPLDVPPLPTRVPVTLQTESQEIRTLAETLRDGMRRGYPTERAGNILQQVMLLNNQGDLRWLWVAARAYAVQAQLENLSARTFRVARLAPGTYDALAGYADGINAPEAALGRAEVREALSLARGTPTPIKRASQAIATVLVDLNNRFLRTNNELAWLRYGSLEGLLRYAEAELSRADKMSGRAWRVLAYARIRRYQARLDEIVPERRTGDTATGDRALWYDLTKRRLDQDFPATGRTGSDTTRAFLAVQLKQSPDALDARFTVLKPEATEPGCVDWETVIRDQKGIPENIATALRLLTLDIEREQIARGRVGRVGELTRSLASQQQ